MRQQQTHGIDPENLDPPRRERLTTLLRLVLLALALYVGYRATMPIVPLLIVMLLAYGAGAVYIPEKIIAADGATEVLIR